MLAGRLVLVGLSLLMVDAARAQTPGDTGKGLVYARSQCAECHAVSAAERNSPRPGLATFKTIANTPGMTGTALAVWLQTPHKAMPDLMVGIEDRDNLIAYIISLRDEPAR